MASQIAQPFSRLVKMKKLLKVKVLCCRQVDDEEARLGFSELWCDCVTSLKRKKMQDRIKILMEKTKSSDLSSHAMEKPEGESSYRTNNLKLVLSSLSMRSGRTALHSVGRAEFMDCHSNLSKTSLPPSVR
ncbi:hypothetical protein NE237_018304 [Protea cynaroides]|uniref:Uncharacterized protein n=1 Tax=Protea cynaroides TaxID=273540 RepID=A0A9Q0K9Q7_9MAGN|nr:hypothetical protein NE237_018304 [Protea cynaroides]